MGSLKLCPPRVFRCVFFFFFLNSTISFVYSAEGAGETESRFISWRDQRGAITIFLASFMQRATTTATAAQVVRTAGCAGKRVKAVNHDQFDGNKPPEGFSHLFSTDELVVMCVYIFSLFFSPPHPIFRAWLLAFQTSGVEREAFIFQSSDLTRVGEAEGRNDKEGETKGKQQLHPNVVVAAVRPSDRSK